MLNAKIKYFSGNPNKVIKYKIMYFVSLNLLAEFHKPDYLS